MFWGDSSKGNALFRRSLLLSVALHGAILLLVCLLLVRQEDKTEETLHSDETIIVLPPDELDAFDTQAPTDDFHEGVRPHSSDSEVQRDIELIRRMFYSHWNGFSYSTELKPVHLVVRFGAEGKIEKFYIKKSGGNSSVDDSVLNAARKIGRISGLSNQFIKQHPEIEIVMKAMPNS